MNKFLKNAHKFQKISYSGIIAFVYVNKDEIHKHIQYEVSMGQDGKSKKRAKWLPFEN